MQKISKHSRIFTDIDDDAILYNSINRAIVSIPQAYLNKNMLNGEIPNSELVSLQEMGFLEEETDVKQVEKEYNEFTNLIISLETLLACNLACPYCYQIGNNSNKKRISVENLDLLYEYIVKVYKISQFKSLTFKVLGGEPTVDWNTADYIIQKLSKFCKEHKIYFKLMIDTNGTIINDLLLLNGYDSLIFTIPLTHKECHDIYRKYPSGQGSYDKIVDNINELSQKLENSTIVLRYNIDSININKFRDYIQDLKSKLIFSPIISPNYTLNLGGGNYENQLKHSDFVKWLSSDFIDIMAEYNYKIVASPFNLSTKCQYWSEYSLKVFSNGTVGACAMNFFDKNNPMLSEVVENMNDISKYWNGAKSYSVFSDLNCKKCSSLFLCGGAYRIPCVKSLNLQECLPDGIIHIDLKLFLKRYLKYSEEGKNDLFVGFNECENYK